VNEIFYGHVVKIEVTKVTALVNELLGKEWVLLRVLETNEHEFIFLMGLCDYPRSEIIGVRKAELSTDAKAI